MNSLFVRCLGAIAIAVLAVGPVSAATVSGTPTLVAQASNASVKGSVVDDTGSPIANATITLSGPQSYRAVTDAKGAFSLDNAVPGIYRLSASRAGFDTASEPDFVLTQGQNAVVSITMHAATLTTLRTIATVRTQGRGTFNTSTAAVNAVPAQAFIDQAQPQVTRVLNQVPGVSISFPGTSANGAVPGAITFPNIRGGLSFETASLLDGHPVSVGTFGDYVTTFLNSFMLGGVDVIKGPGANSPEVNYAIGGTVNFRTKDPTLTATPDYTFGYSNHGGTFANLGISDTIANGKLGIVLDVAQQNEPSAVNGYQAYFNPAQNAVVGFGSGTPTILGNKTTSNTIPGTNSTVTNQWSLIGCCYPVYGNYSNVSELVKFRYKFSNATVATVSYLGSQTTADQNGNTSSWTGGATFAPGAGYSNSSGLGAGPFTFTSIHPGGQDIETNNEPILQAELRTTLGNDTLLGRFYHAGIHRLINQGSQNIDTPTITNNVLYGTDATGKVYNGINTSIAYYDYFQQTENDALNGTSFEWDHPFNDKNTLSFAWDATNSTTTSFSISSCATNTSASAKAGCNPTGKLNPAAGPSISINIPTGSGQLFNTFLLRDRFTLSDKLSGVLSLYDNKYSSTVASSCIGVCAYGKQWYDGTGYNFSTFNTSHFDERLGLEYRPLNNLAVRFAAGSAIAPPYLGILSTTNSNANYVSATQTAVENLNTGAPIKPETAFGYDFGADYRLKDGVTYLSGDVYLTNLFNHFVGQEFASGYTCSNLPANIGTCTGTGFLPTTPVYFSSTVNLANTRYEGLELQVKRIVPVGLNYTVSASLNHSYAYNLPAGFYCQYATPTPCTVANYNTNLAIVNNQQLTQGPIGFNGFSNQNVPILMGNAEVSWHFQNGAYASFGETLYGKNNSLNLPPFGLAYATVRYPINKAFSLQVSGTNIFNAWNDLFPTFGGGVAIPLANGGAGATMRNTLGPAQYNFVLTKNIGPDPAPNP